MKHKTLTPIYGSAAAAAAGILSPFLFVYLFDRQNKYKQ